VGLLQIVSQPSQITDNAQRFALAVREPAIKDQDEEELKKALRYVFMVVGIRGQNIPTGVDKEFLHNYIRTHYGNHTPSEIRQAFDMAVQGLLDIDSRDVRCYENFSVMYFATIMKAYRIWAAEQSRKLEQSVKPVGPTAEQLKKIDAEYLDFLFWRAFMWVKQIDKLPTPYKQYREWQRANLKTK